MTAPVFGVVGGQKNLRHGHLVQGQGILPGMSQLHLPGGSCGLTFIQAQHPVARAAGQAEQTPPHRDRARRDNQHLRTGTTQPRNILGERGKPVGAQLAVLERQQRGSDLNDNPPALGQIAHVSCSAARS